MLPSAGVLLAVFSEVRALLAEVFVEGSRFPAVKLGQG